MTTLGVGQTSEANLPDWIINTPGMYTVRAEAILATDGDTSNNIMTQITQVGLVDGAFVSIDIPKALMGPAPFSPMATVSNLGDLDFDIATVGLLPVHAWVMDPSGGAGLCYEEDFEGATGFYEFPGDVEVFMNPDDLYGKVGDYVRFDGSIKWPDDEKQFGDPADWTILNPDNNGAIWHATTYRSSSPVQSMYAGDEITKTYLPNSVDILISPAIYVGTAGGSFDFDMYNDVEGAPYDYMVFGASPDGMTWGWWFGSSWWMTWYAITGIPIYPTDVDANGYTHLGFAFFSESSVEYEGIYIDNVKAYGSPYLYDETLYVDLDAGATNQVTFPTFTPLAGYSTYTMNICCEHPEDNVPANDCGSLTFLNNAPVYIAETGFGYATIQEGIDVAEVGQTVVVVNGTYYEDLVINKSVTVTGEWMDATLDKTNCKYEFDHGTFLVGTVDIIPTPVGEEPPEECTCDYEINLYDILW